MRAAEMVLVHAVIVLEEALMGVCATGVGIAPAHVIVARLGLDPVPVSPVLGTATVVV